MDEEMHKNGWHTYQKLVLAELKNLHDKNEYLGKEIHRLSNEIIRLQERTSIRAAISGAVAGAVPTIAGLLYILAGG